ncbi:hypothetical protein D3C85_974630 [compost metagenome]
MAAAEGMVPRQPIHQDGWFLDKLRERLAQHLLIRAQHLLSGNHRFGQLGGTGREQEFGYGGGLNLLERRKSVARIDGLA